MKTWEVYKTALENPKARFIRKSATGSSEFKLNVNSELQMIGYSKSAVPRVDEEWELVREPVDFMTAINSGKNIKSCKCDEFHNEYWYRITAGLSLAEINGNWYIED